MRMTPARLQPGTSARRRVEQARLSTIRSTRTNLRLTRSEHTFVRRRARACQASYSVVKEPMLRAWRSFNLLLFYERASRQAPDNKKPGVERRAKPSLYSVGTDSRDARQIVYPVFVTNLTPSLLHTRKTVGYDPDRDPYGRDSTTDSEV